MKKKPICEKSIEEMEADGWEGREPTEKESQKFIKLGNDSEWMKQRKDESDDYYFKRISPALVESTLSCSPPEDDLYISNEKIFLENENESALIYVISEDLEAMTFFDEFFGKNRNPFRN